MARLGNRAAVRLIDAGFTLVELITVSAITAVLAAIAIATLVGPRHHASDQATADRLSAALSALDEVWAQYGTFCLAGPAGPCSGTAQVMNGMEAQVVSPVVAEQVTSTVPPASPVVWVTTGDEATLGALSPSGLCLYLDFAKAPVSGLAAGTWYGTGPPTSGQCSMAGTPASGWRSSWGDAGA